MTEDKAQMNDPKISADGSTDGGIKFDGDKPRPDFIYPKAIIDEGRVLQLGAAKYKKHNWAKGMSWSRVLGAMQRHMLAWAGGESKDPESGISHLAHVRVNAAFLMAYEDAGIGTDDRLCNVLKGKVV